MHWFVWYQTVEEFEIPFVVQREQLTDNLITFLSPMVSIPSLTARSWGTEVMCGLIEK